MQIKMEKETLRLSTNITCQLSDISFTKIDKRYHTTVFVDILLNTDFHLKINKITIITTCHNHIIIT